MRRGLVLAELARRGWIAWLGVMTILAANAAAAEPGLEVEYRPNVTYGTAAGEPLTLHLALPKGGPTPRPVILYIHGGGWRMGSKDGHVDEIKEAAARGYVAASVGYRFAPKHRFPAQVEDVKCAVRWVRAHADELGADPQRIGAIGFSAGAHLSMLLGTMDSGDGLEGDGGWPDQASKVQAVVAYFGPTNFVGAEYPALSRGLVFDFLNGSEDQQPENYRLASPVTYVSPGDAPMLLFQGTNDVLVPYQQAYQMADKLTAAGVPGRVEILLGLGHGWKDADLVRSRAQAWEFFDGLLKPAAPANKPR